MPKTVNILIESDPIDRPHRYLAQYCERFLTYLDAIILIKRWSMTTKIQQYAVGKDNLNYFYRFIILPWELEWKDKKFLMDKGSLRNYCKEKSINIKSFESTDKLDEAIRTKYQAEEHKTVGIFWFVRKDTKPKDILRHLRNCLAHGNFKRQQKNRNPCISIENIDKGRVKAKGFIPIDELSRLVRAARSCEV